MKSVLITGCNRGLGLEFVKQLVKQQNPPAKIIATCRSLEKAQVNNSPNHKHITPFGIFVCYVIDELSALVETHINYKNIM